MAGEVIVNVPTVILQAASPEQPFEIEIRPAAQASTPSISENYTLPSPGPHVGNTTRERRPSLAHRRFHSRKESSVPPEMTMTTPDEHEGLNAGIPTPGAKNPPRRQSRWGSLDVGNMGFSYMATSPFRIDFERPRTSIRETFDRTQVHLAHMGVKLEEKLGWNERVRHFTWNFFSMTMATGGIANLLHTSKGLCIGRKNGARRR